MTEHGIGKTRGVVIDGELFLPESRLAEAEALLREWMKVRTVYGLPDKQMRQRTEDFLESIQQSGAVQASGV